MQSKLMNDIQQIKAQHSIRDLFQKDGHKLIPIAGLLKCQCPFHCEKTPSCVVYEDHFHCFGCHSRGDVIDYLQMYHGYSKGEALRKLRGAVNHLKPVPVKFLKNPNESVEIARDFEAHMQAFQNCTHDSHIEAVANRIGVFTDSLNALQCAWSRCHEALAIPMRDAREKIVGIRLRDLNGRKWAVKGSKDGLFIPSFFQPIRTLFITEGPTDCAACLSLGFDAIGRANALSKICLQQAVEFVKIHRVCEVVVVADNDAAGLDGATKLRQALPVKSKQLLCPSKDLRGFVQIGGGKQIVETMLAGQLYKRP